MYSSFATERGSSTMANMWGLIRHEAHALALTVEQTSSAIFVFPKPAFPDIHGIKPINVTSVALYTRIEDEGDSGAGPYVVNTWSLELLELVSEYKKTVCPFTRY